MSKLNDGQRGEIFALLDSGVSYQSIADKFGVSRQAISKIADRKLEALASNVVAEEVARNQNVVAATEVAPQPKLPPQPDSSQKTRLPQPVVAPVTLVAATNSGLPATNPQPKTGAFVRPTHHFFTGEPMEVFNARIAKEAAEAKARLSQPDSFTPPPWDMAGQELPTGVKNLGEGGVR